MQSGLPGSALPTQPCFTGANLAGAPETRPRCTCTAAGGSTATVTNQPVLPTGHFPLSLSTGDGAPRLAGDRGSNASSFTPVPSFTCWSLSPELSLPLEGAPGLHCLYPTVRRGGPRQGKAPASPNHEPASAPILPARAPYLVLVGGIKGDLGHLGVFLSHLLHRAVRLLDELEEG